MNINERTGGEDLGLEIFKRALMDQSNSLPIITTLCLSTKNKKEDEILVDGSSLMENKSSSGSSGGSNGSGGNNGSSSTTILSNSTPGTSHSNPTIAAVATASTFFVQDYDEYEQQQPSPWSQSPAPSPAIMDPEINPFFQSPPDIDDEAFNPVSPEGSHCYQNTTVPFPPPISNVHSIVHVPLFHPSGSSVESPLYNNQVQTNIPIAILSFLAPIVPYPPILLSSIASLSPFIAASFTNAIENAQMKKKQNQLYNNRNDKATTPINENSTSRRPKNYKKRSGATASNSKKQQRRHDFGDENDGDEDLEKEEGNDSGNDEEVQSQQGFDSTNTTPKAEPNSRFVFMEEKRPDRLGSMSNFTRSSLETVTEDYDQTPLGKTHTQQQQPNDSTTTDFSSDSFSFSSITGRGDQEASTNSIVQDLSLIPPSSAHPTRKRSISSSSNYRKEQRRLSQSSKSKKTTTLSPSSVAVMEGWDAVSPTTGLPISASIPPHSMCSDKYCVKHHLGHEDNDIDTDTELTDDCDDKELSTAITMEHPTIARASSGGSSTTNGHGRTMFRSSTTRRRRNAKIARYTKRKSSSKKYHDDDGFHYHKQPQQNNDKNGVNRFLVAPKSSLLRLIIDGIPIHVL